MTIIRNIGHNVTAAAAALAVSALFITAAAGPVSVPADSPAVMQHVA